MYDIEALLTERAGYLARGRKDRAAQVAEILRTQGVEVVDEPEAAVLPKAENAARPKARR